MNPVVVTTLIDILGVLALGVWKLLLYVGFFSHALVFFFSSMTHGSLCLLVAVCFFFLAIFCNVFIQDKVTAFAC